MGPRPAAKSTDFAGHLFGVFRLPRDADDVRALGGESQRDGPSDAAPGAGHDRNLIVQLTHNGCLLSVVIGVQRTPKSERTYPASALAVSSRLGTSATLIVQAFLSIRFMKPLNALPGPNSMKRVKPCASK